MRILDKIQEICYTDLGSLDRVNPLGLGVRLAATGSLDRVNPLGLGVRLAAGFSAIYGVGHIIAFDSCYHIGALLHGDNGNHLTPFAVCGQRRHGIGAGDVSCFCGVVQGIDGDCILNQRTSHSAKLCIGCKS